MPQYENLSVEMITAEAIKYKELEPYWPHERDLPRIGRSWLCNMIHTVVGSRFNMWVRMQVLDRNEKLAKDRNLELELDPEVAKFFSQSTAVSSKYRYRVYYLIIILIIYLHGIATHGTGVNLLKPNVVRRRSKAQIIQDKLDEGFRVDEKRDMEVRMEFLEKQIASTTE